MGKRDFGQVPICFLCVLLYFFTFSFTFLKKKTAKNKKTQNDKNITMPLNKRLSGKRWILRTFRKADIGRYIPAFVGPAHHIRERRKKMDVYGKGKGHLHGSIFALLSWHSYSFGSRIPVCKRLRRTWLENLILYVGQLHVITREKKTTV